MAGGKRAKLVDIRDHLTKAVLLRERLVLFPGEREAWVLEGKAELKSIVEAADDWFEQVRIFRFVHLQILHMSSGVNKVFLRTSFSIKSIWSMTIDRTQNEVASPLQHCDKLLTKGT
jgi:hypothetical protein